MGTKKEIREKAWDYIKEGKYEESEKLYRYIIKDGPNIDDITNFGAALRKIGKIKEAIQLYEQWIEEYTSSKIFTLNAINCAIESRRLDLGYKWLKIGKKVHLNDIDLQIGEARLLHADEKTRESITILEKLDRQSPNRIEIKILLGIAYHNNGAIGEAIKCFDWCRIKQPSEPQHIANLVTAMEKNGDCKDGLRIIRSLNQKVAENIQIRAAHAFLLLKNEEMEEAIIIFRQLIKQEPYQPLHSLNLCAALRSLKRSNEATKIIQLGIKYNPDKKILYHALSQCLGETGKHKQAAKIMIDELKAGEKLSDEQIYNIHFLGEGYKAINEEYLIKMARDWEYSKKKEGVGPIYNDRIVESRKDRKLKIGYLSADFCDHPVGRFLLPILRNTNEANLEIYGITSKSKDDKISELLRINCNHWICIENMSDIEAARKISELGIDILIELGGYTSGSRIGVLCHKPVKIQLSYLGYFGPTYLNCIDGWIGDEMLFCNLNQKQKNAHKLIRIKGGYMCYKEEELPVINERESGPFRFGCFNHARKLSSEAIELFCKIIKENKGSILVLKSISFIEKEEQKRIRYAFKKKGLREAQLSILPWVEGRQNHMRSYSKMDVALDPFPYGGATTTCEALIMGVPVISMKGESMVENLSTSILKYGECSEWIVNDLDEYIELSKRLAKIGKRSVKQREGLRMKIINSRLGDAKRLTEELERTYQELVDI